MNSTGRQEDILIADLTCAAPSTAWTDADSTLFKPIAQVAPDTWRIINYKSRLYHGRMLQATSPNAPPLKAISPGWGSTTRKFSASGARPTWGRGTILCGRWPVLHSSILARALLFEQASFTITVIKLCR